MTPTVGIYTLIVQMCVKSREGYLPWEAGTTGHKFSFRKSELIVRPVFALISKALQNTEFPNHHHCLFLTKDMKKYPSQKKEREKYLIGKAAPLGSGKNQIFY